MSDRYHPLQQLGPDFAYLVSATTYCMECGVPVVDEVMHDEWHESISRAIAKNQP